MKRPMTMTKAQDRWFRAACAWQLWLTSEMTAREAAEATGADLDVCNELGRRAECHISGTIKQLADVGALAAQLGLEKAGLA